MALINHIQKLELGLLLSPLDFTNMADSSSEFLEGSQFSLGKYFEITTWNSKVTDVLLRLEYRKLQIVD